MPRFPMLGKPRYFFTPRKIVWGWLTGGPGARRASSCQNRAGNITIYTKNHIERSIMSKRTIFSDCTYNGLKIKECQCPYTWYSELLDPLYKLFLTAKERHNSKRTITTRFDFKFPTNYPDSCEGVFSTFLAEFVKNVPEEYELLYIWVREQSESDHPHYHLQLLASKLKHRSFHHLFNYANVLWCKHLDIPLMRGYVQENRTHTINWQQDRNAGKNSLADAFHHAVYLAKTTEKSQALGNKKLYGRSEI